MTYILGLVWLALSIGGIVDGEVILATSCAFAALTSAWSIVLNRRIRMLESEQ